MQGGELEVGSPFCHSTSKVVQGKGPYLPKPCYHNSSVLHSLHVQLRKLWPGDVTGLAQRLGPRTFPYSRCRGWGQQCYADCTASGQPVQRLRAEVQGGGGSGAGPGNSSADWRQCSRRPTLQEAKEGSLIVETA